MMKFNLAPTGYKPSDLDQLKEAWQRVCSTLTRNERLVLYAKVANVIEDLPLVHNERVTRARKVGAEKA